MKYHHKLFSNASRQGKKSADITNDTIVFVADTKEDYDRMVEIIDIFKEPCRTADSFDEKVDVVPDCNAAKKQVSVRGEDRWQVMRAFYQKGFLKISPEEYNEFISKITPVLKPF
jgi:hypothetical protein